MHQLVQRLHTRGLGAHGRLPRRLLSVRPVQPVVAVREPGWVFRVPGLGCGVWGLGGGGWEVGFGISGLGPGIWNLSVRCRAEGVGFRV